jgi:hypothetical protein
MAILGVPIRIPVWRNGTDARRVTQAPKRRQAPEAWRRYDRDYTVRRRLSDLEWFADDAVELYTLARTAYRVEAERRHPDHGGAVESMQALNGAWTFVQRWWKRREMLHVA